MWVKLGNFIADSGEFKIMGFGVCMMLVVAGVSEPGPNLFHRLSSWRVALSDVTKGRQRRRLERDHEFQSLCTKSISKPSAPGSAGRQRSSKPPGPRKLTDPSLRHLSRS